MLNHSANARDSPLHFIANQKRDDTENVAAFFRPTRPVPLPLRMSSELSTRDAFEAQLSPILPLACATAMRLTNGHDDAQDLLQDATIRAFNSFAQFQTGTNFKAWFLRVLTTTFLNSKRRQATAPQIARLEENEEIEDSYLFRHAAQAGLVSRKNDPAQLLMSHLESAEIGGALVF